MPNFNGEILSFAENILYFVIWKLNLFLTCILWYLKVCRVPYVQLISHPTWNSRTSSWTLSVNVPQSILHVGCQTQISDKNVKAQFRTKVVVNDDCIKVEGEGAPNVVGLFKGTSASICSINRYDCDLADLPVILLQQVCFCLNNF